MFKELSVGVALAISAVSSFAAPSTITITPNNKTVTIYSEHSKNFSFSVGAGGMNLDTSNLTTFISSTFTDITRVELDFVGGTFSQVSDLVIDGTEKWALSGPLFLTPGAHTLTVITPTFGQPYVGNLVQLDNGAGRFVAGSGQVHAVPEPETYAMMLAGLGALGFMSRRRKAS